MQIPRRVLLGGAAAAAGVAALGRPAPAHAGTETSLGRPLQGFTTAGAGYTQSSTGRYICVVVAGGIPSEMSALDMDTGEFLTHKTLGSLSRACWTMETTPDRKVHFATEDGIWTFDPDTLVVAGPTALPSGQTNTFTSKVSAAGTSVFYGTYPGGKLYEFNTATRAWTDRGQVQASAQYARCVDTWGSNKVVVGLGTPAGLRVVDLGTNLSTPIALPSTLPVGQEFTMNVSVRNNLLFARFSPSNQLHVHDLTTSTWVDSIADVNGFELSPPFTTTVGSATRTEVMITPLTGPMIAYDLTTRARRTTALDLAGYAGRDWMLTTRPGVTGPILITATSTAKFFHWRAQANTVTSIQGEPMTAAYSIRTVAKGPDGDIYVGGYLAVPMAHVDSTTGTATPYSPTHQIEGFGVSGTKLVYGVYPGGELRTYDPSLPWNMTAGNPTAPVHIGHNQDRPIAFATLPDGKLAIGCVANYGHLGGGLAIFDPVTQTVTSVLENLITDQTICTLIERDGFLYGGTVIWGGLGTTPATTEGRLFIVDLSTMTVVHNSVPVPGDTQVNGLAFDASGFLWGQTTRSLFRFNTTTRTVSYYSTFWSADVNQTYFTGRDLYWSGGKLVGATANRVYEFTPGSGLPPQMVAWAADTMAIDGNGDYYYRRGSELCKWTLS